MPTFHTKTPVVFLVFNRPDTTIKVFEEIRRARPPKLLLVADGPRAEKAGEAEKCEAVRSIIETVDWPCEVLKNFSEVNLGCRKRISSGLDWAFDQVEEAIILEDDCLPHPSFFRFCEELLARYRDDERIFLISGDNYQFGRQRSKDSYYFSRYCHIWGWATWRRSWRHYDATISKWPLIKEGRWLQDILGDRNAFCYWTGIMDMVYEGKIDTWDYQLNLCSWLRNALNIMPNVNMVSNIGFGADATHDKNESPLSNMAVSEMVFPLIHPDSTIRDSIADAYTEAMQFRSTFAGRLRKKVKSQVKSLIWNTPDR